MAARALPACLLALLALWTLAGPASAVPSGTVLTTYYVNPPEGFVNCGNDLGLLELLVPAAPDMDVSHRCAGFRHDGTAQDVTLDIHDASGQVVGGSIVFWGPGIGSVPGGLICGSATVGVPAGATSIEVALYPYYSQEACGGRLFATAGYVQATFA